MNRITTLAGGTVIALQLYQPVQVEAEEAESDYYLEVSASEVRRELGGVDVDPNSKVDYNQLMSVELGKHVSEHFDININISNREERLGADNTFGVGGSYHMQWGILEVELEAGLRTHEIEEETHGEFSDSSQYPDPYGVNVEEEKPASLYAIPKIIIHAGDNFSMFAEHEGSTNDWGHVSSLGVKYDFDGGAYVSVQAYRNEADVELKNLEGNSLWWDTRDWGIGTPDNPILDSLVESTGLILNIGTNF